jgi:hypothetical protein
MNLNHLKRITFVTVHRKYVNIYKYVKIGFQKVELHSHYSTYFITLGYQLFIKIKTLINIFVFKN